MAYFLIGISSVTISQGLQASRNIIFKVGVESISVEIFQRALVWRVKLGFILFLLGMFLPTRQQTKGVGYEDGIIVLQEWLESERYRSLLAETPPQYYPQSPGGPALS